MTVRERLLLPRAQPLQGPTPNPARRRQSAAGARPKPTPKRSRARQQAVTTSERSASARSRARQQAVSPSSRSASVGDKHFAKPPAGKREFSETCSKLFKPYSRTKAEFSWICSCLFTPHSRKTPRGCSDAYEVFAPSGITPTNALRAHRTPSRTPFSMTPNGPSPRTGHPPGPYCRVQPRRPAAATRQLTLGCRLATPASRRWSRTRKVRTSSSQS